jgi:hypothetical protein
MTVVPLLHGFPTLHDLNLRESALESTSAQTASDTTTTPMNSAQSEKFRIWRSLLPATCAIAVGMAAISTQSLWMDEGGTMFRAMISGLGDWWRMLLHLRGSEVQMPVYMLYAWFWHQKLGALSEYALRLSNLPWLFLTVMVLRHVRFWPLVCLISPFVLYYVDEFRPYSMQIAAGACAAAALGRVISGVGREGFVGVHAVCGACLFLIVCSLNGAVYAAGLALGVVIIRPDWLRAGGFWLRAMPWLAASLAVGGFYGWTLMMGYRAAGVETAGVLNILFGFYEMAGLLGLGPGKDELRRSVSAILPHLWILIPASACIAGAWWCGFHRWAVTTPRRIVAGAVCAAMLPVLILTVAGLLMEFRVLGRHLSPAIPAVLLPIAHSLDLRGTSRKTPFFFGVCACVLMLVSSLVIRFSERHAKDDYRQATELALAELAQGKRILWQADMNAPRYYAYRKGGLPMVHRIQVLETDLPGLMFADVVFINRPDHRYRNTDHQSLLKGNYFKLRHKFTGFEVWSLE